MQQAILVPKQSQLNAPAGNAAPSRRRRAELATKKETIVIDRMASCCEDYDETEL
jgi:hypothetical protein